MPSLPSVSGREAAKAFERLGWSVVRHNSGHLVMTKEGEQATLSIPDHKEVAKGTLRSLIRSANVTASEYIAAL